MPELGKARIGGPGSKVRIWHSLSQSLEEVGLQLKKSRGLLAPHAPASVLPFGDGWCVVQTSHSSLRDRSCEGARSVALNQEISQDSNQEPRTFYPKGTQHAKNNAATPEGETEELGRSGSALPSSWIINPLLPLKMWVQASSHQ